MYSFILATHNIVRWFVLIFGLLAVIKAFIGWSGKKQCKGLDDKLLDRITGFASLKNQNFYKNFPKRIPH